MRVVQHGNILTPGAWAGSFIDSDDLMPAGARVDASQFYATDSVLVTATATANIGDTSVSCKALTGAIPAGQVIDFSTNGTKLARLSSAAVVGDTHVTVYALAAAVTSGNSARFAGGLLPTAYRKVVYSGTLIGRTTAEAAAHVGYGPWQPGDDECYIVPFEKWNLDTGDDYIELLLPGKDFVIKENFLPDYTNLSAAAIAVQEVVVAGSLSAGVLGLRSPDTNKTAFVAYNGNLAAIQTAIDAIFGVNTVVAAGTIADFTLTFDGTTHTWKNKKMAKLEVVTLPTGATSAAVTTTTEGGTPTLDQYRALWTCIQGVN